MHRIKAVNGKPRLETMETKKTQYIILSKGAHESVSAVVAPKGYCRLADGSIAKDGTPSPEMGRLEKAYRFKSHRSASRTASAMGFPEIKPVNW